MSSTGLELSKSSPAADLVRRFCVEWPGLAPSDIAAFFAPDFVYQHMSVARPLVGPQMIAGAIEVFRARFEQIESEVLAIAESAGTVLCEREDRFWLPGGRIVGFRAMASMVTSEGKISFWNDYYDLATLSLQVDLTEA